MIDTQVESFSQHRPLLFGIAWRMLGNAADAEDILQEAFLRWQRTVESDIRSPKAFLQTVRALADSPVGLPANQLDLEPRGYALISRVFAGAAEPSAFPRGLRKRAPFFRRRVRERLLPGPDDQLAAWRQDYQTMRGEMFFGDVPKFDEILRVVGEFERQFNDSANASN